MQIDQAERGFSFRNDGPLDMRMEQKRPERGRSRQRILRSRARRHLLSLRRGAARPRRRPRHHRDAAAPALRDHACSSPISSHRSSARSPAAFIRRRACSRACASPSTTSSANSCARCMRPERILKPGGRLVVVTFHSLEDRIVKQFFAARTGRAPAGSRHLPTAAAPEPTFDAITRGPVGPSEQEMAQQSAGALGQAPGRRPHGRAAAGTFERHRHAGRAAADSRETGRAPVIRLLHFIAISVAHRIGRLCLFDQV